MFDWLKKLIVSRYATGAIRALLAAVSGWLLEKGFQADVVEPFITHTADFLIAVVTMVGTVGWSWLDKSKTKLKSEQS